MSDEKKKILDTHIYKLKFSYRTNNILTSNGISTVRELVSLSYDELKNIFKDKINNISYIIIKIHNLGLKFIDEITDKEIQHIVKNNEITKHALCMPIEYLELTEGLYNKFKNSGINTVNDILKIGYEPICKKFLLKSSVSNQLLVKFNNIGINLLHADLKVIEDKTELLYENNKNKGIEYYRNLRTEILDMQLERIKKNSEELNRKAIDIEYDRIRRNK